MSVKFMGVDLEEGEEVVNTIDQDLLDMVGGSIEDFEGAPLYKEYRAEFNPDGRVWVIIKKKGE